MKRTAKNLMSAAALPLLVVLLLASCSSESRYDEPGKPDQPNLDPERREVMLTLNNKLDIRAAKPRAGIATPEENTISTLDVYVFGSPTENGTYTYQQRFAYRSDEAVPDAVEELQLSKATDGDGSVTTGLLSLKRGLFVKLYCVANDTTLINPASGTPMKIKNYIPIRMNPPGSDTPIQQVGVPLEQDFLKFHTALLTAAQPIDTEGEVLLTPLSMSGAMTTPLDLTDPTATARLQARLRLTRLAARFDIVNDAAKSRFTLQSISMGNARRGASFFPIAIKGDIPAKAGELITLTPRTFSSVTLTGGAAAPTDVPNANHGLSTGAFYSYPSPVDDKGYLILKGLYRVNQTEQKEVTYQVPFTRDNGNGAQAWLEINNNHRYTLAITDADDYHLDFTLDVADWTDDGAIDHYDPDNQSDPVLVGNLLPDGRTEYNPATRTVTLCLDIKQECSFTVHAASNNPLKAQLDYPQAQNNPKLHWLVLEKLTPDADYKPQGSIAVKYKVSQDNNYTGAEFPGAVLRISDMTGLYSERIVINPQPYPVPAPTPPFTPSVANELNRFNAADTLLYLYRVTGSTLPMRLICADGVTPPEDTAWYTIERTGGLETAPEFTLTLTDRSVVLPDDRATLMFYNKKWPTLGMPMKVQLMEAELTNPQLETGTENAAFDETTQTVSLKVRKDSKCGISVEAYKQAQITRVDYEESPLGHASEDWLVYTGKEKSRGRDAANAGSPDAGQGTADSRALTPAWGTAAGAAAAGNACAYGNAYGDWASVSPRSVILPHKERRTLEFSMKNDANIKYFGRAKVTVTNTCLGPDEVYYIEPEYLVPAITAATPMVPSANNYDSTTKTLYMVQQAAGKTSQGTISVYAPGGSRLELPDGITAAVTGSEAQTQLYTLEWAGTDDKETGRTLTLKIINKSDDKKVETITVKALASDISDLTLEARATAGVPGAALAADKKSLTMDIKEGNWIKLGMKAYGADAAVKVLSKPAWLTAGEPAARATPAQGYTHIIFTLDKTKTSFPAGDIVLQNPVGGPNLTLRVNPVFQLPAVSTAAPMMPSANNYDTTEKTLYMVQQAAGETSQASISIYAMGGSKLELPAGITATATESDEHTQLYTLKWAGTDDKLTDRTLTLKVFNKSDPNKVESLTVKTLASDISDLSMTPQTAGATTMTADKKNITVDIKAGNWFKLGMKAYGADAAVKVLSKPAWLTAGAPAARTVPAKGNTSITFTVDGTKTDFTAGNLVLKNPMGGPDMTIRIIPKYLKPALSANPAGFSTCGSWYGNCINLVQMRTAQATSTAKIYALGGSKGKLMNTLGGLTMTQTAHTAATNRDYPLAWAATNATLNDQTTTLRVFNHDESQYLDIPVRLVSNGALDIKNTLGAWNPNPTMGGKNLRLTVGIDVPIEEGKTFNVQMYSYGGATVAANKAGWLEYTTTETNTGAAYATQSITTLNFKVKNQDGAYTANTFTMRPKLGGPDLVVTAKPVYRAPAVSAASGMNPTANNWDAAQNTLYLLQKPQGQTSVGTLTVKSMGGSQLAFTSTLSGLTLSKTSSTKMTDTYEVRWAGSNSVLSAQQATLRLKNNSNTAVYKDITVKLIPNTLADLKLTAQNGGISLTGYNGTTATLTMPIIKDRQFTISMKSYGTAATAGTAPTASKVPAWLQQVQAPRNAPVQGTYTATYKLIENAANFNDTQLVFTNPGGGPAVTINITRQFQTPTVTDGGSPVPACNSFSGSTVNVYRTKAGTETTTLIKVYSLGGSDIVSAGGWFKYPVEKTEGNHTKYYRVGHNNSQTDANYNSVYDATFQVRNASDTGKSATMKIHFYASRPVQFTSDYNSIRFNDKGKYDDWCYTDLNYNGSNTNAGTTELRGKCDVRFTITSPGGLNVQTGTRGDFVLTLVSSTKNADGSTTDTFNMHIKGSNYFGGGATAVGEFVLVSKISGHFKGYTLKTFNYHPVDKGYWASLYDNNTGRYWVNAGATSDTPAAAVTNVSKYSGWRLPTKEEYRTFVGWTKAGTNSNWNDEGWYSINSSNIGSNFWTIFNSSGSMKCFSNDAGWRFDIQTKANNKAGYDVAGYGGEQRYYILIAP